MYSLHINRLIVPLISVVTSADMIEITDVAILNEGEEWTEKAYSLQGGVMDGVS